VKPSWLSPMFGKCWHLEGGVVRREYDSDNQQSGDLTNLRRILSSDKVKNPLMVDC
jgi:hypothetical protein